MTENAIIAGLLERNALMLQRLKDVAEYLEVSLPDTTNFMSDQCEAKCIRDFIVGIEEKPPQGGDLPESKESGIYSN
jgi:hypothetical protein